MARVPLSVLDLVGISEGATPRDAIEDSMKLAKIADTLGYTRLWFAEHHNTINLASSATSILIGRAASETERIRVGSGGVMLPNHAPLMVAEQYGTLAQMYPGRIDLGLGRAPGTDQMTARALSRSSAEPQEFAQNIYEMQGWFSDRGAGQALPIFSAVSAGTNVPICVLGSTVNGASIAGQLGLPFSIASHFAPDQVNQAIAVYRESFTTEAPTAQIEKPYVLAGINVLVADTDEEAEREFTTILQMFADTAMGRKRKIQPPIDPEQAREIDNPMLKIRAVGSRKMWSVGSTSSSKKLGPMKSSRPPTPTILPCGNALLKLLAENWF